MFGATEAGRVHDVHGAALRIHSDDVSAEAGVPVVILEMAGGAVMLTRSQWAMLVSYGDQVLGIHEDTAEGQQARTAPEVAPGLCAGCMHLLLKHGPEGCTCRVFPAHSLDGEPCPCDFEQSVPESPYACICGEPIPRGAFAAGYRVCREHLPNPGYAGTYDKAAGQDGAR